MRDLIHENNSVIANMTINGRRNIASYHRQVLIEYQRMNQVATEYERKHVYRIECLDCNAVLTDRGMNVSFRKSFSVRNEKLTCILSKFFQAVLLSDRSIQLFSTDLLPDT